MKRRICLGLLMMLILCLTHVCGVYADGILSLPQALTAIEDRAFENDAALRRIILPDGVATIGSRAFAGSGLNEINFPEGLKTISGDAFEGCGHIEVHTLHAEGLWMITQMQQLGYDVAWADEVFNAIATYPLRAAAGQTIRRPFLAPQGGTYTFAVGSDDEELSVSCFDVDGSLRKAGGSSVSVDLRKDDGVYIDSHFADSTHAGDFSLAVSCVDKPMLDILYTPQLWVYKDDKPVRDAQMNGSLAQLGIGEVLTPVLKAENTGNYRVAGQVTAKLDGQTVDLGFFALGDEGSGAVPLPAELAFAAETAGNHEIEYSVVLEGTEKVASMTWEIKDQRPGLAEAVAVKQGSNTVELSEAEGNLFKFTPSQNGVYKIYTATKNCDTYAVLRDGKTGEIIVEDDDASATYQNFAFSHTLKAKELVYVEIGMKNYKGATDVTLNVEYCGTPNLKYSHSLYVFDRYSDNHADRGELDGAGMIKLKDKGDLSTLENDEYLTPVMEITNSSGKAMPLGLTAVVDGDVVPWHMSCEVPARGTFVAYLYDPYARMYEKPGKHTIDYYINGQHVTSYTWEVTATRAFPNYYVYTAWCSALYRFYSEENADTVGILYDQDMNVLAYNDDRGDELGFEMYQYLEAGDTVHLRSVMYDDPYDLAVCKMEVVSTEPAPKQIVSLGTIAMPMKSDEVQTFSFTAPYAGEFKFYGKEGGGLLSSIDGVLYDTYWREKELSGTGYDEHFSLRCRMEKGETVYLKATCSWVDSGAQLIISCTQRD